MHQSQTEGEGKWEVSVCVCVNAVCPGSHALLGEARQILSGGEIALLKIYCFKSNWVQPAAGEKKNPPSASAEEGSDREAPLI